MEGKKKENEELRKERTILNYTSLRLSRHGLIECKMGVSRLCQSTLVYPLFFCLCKETMAEFLSVALISAHHLEVRCVRCALIRT